MTPLFNQGSRQQPGDESLFRWRKDGTNGQTNDLVTDADVLLRAAAIVEARPYSNPPAGITHNVHGVFLRWLAFRLESEPSTDGDMKQP